MLQFFFQKVHIRVNRGLMEGHELLTQVLADFPLLQFKQNYKNVNRGCNMQFHSFISDFKYVGYYFILRSEPG